MAMYAVPLVALLEADSEDHAYEVANLKIQNPYLGTGISILLDEQLDAFPYDPDKHEVHSALDRAEISTTR